MRKDTTVSSRSQMQVTLYTTRALTQPPQPSIIFITTLLKIFPREVLRRIHQHLPLPPVYSLGLTVNHPPWSYKNVRDIPRISAQEAIFAVLHIFGEKLHVTFFVQQICAYLSVSRKLSGLDISIRSDLKARARIQ